MRLVLLITTAAAAALCPGAGGPAARIDCQKCTLPAAPTALARRAGGVAMRATSSPGPSGRADDDGAAQPLPPEDTSVYTDPQATPQELAEDQQVELTAAWANGTLAANIAARAAAERLAALLRPRLT